MNEKTLGLFWSSEKILRLKIGVKISILSSFVNKVYRRVILMALKFLLRNTQKNFTSY